MSLITPLTERVKSRAIEAGYLAKEAVAEIKTSPTPAKPLTTDIGKGEVLRLAEEQLEDCPRGVAHVGFELSDAAEQRAREDAAVVEDHCLDHAGRVSVTGRHLLVERWRARGCRRRW